MAEEPEFAPEPQRSWREWVAHKGLPDGAETNYEAAVDSQKAKTKSRARKEMIERGINTLKQKTLPGAPPPTGQLTVEEVYALRHLGFNPEGLRIADGAGKPKPRVSDKEMARRKARRRQARKTRKSQRK